MSPIAAKKINNESSLGSIVKPVITGLAFIVSGITDGGCELARKYFEGDRVGKIRTYGKEYKFLIKYIKGVRPLKGVYYVLL